MWFSIYFRCVSYHIFIHFVHTRSCDDVPAGYHHIMENNLDISISLEIHLYTVSLYMFYIYVYYKSLFMIIHLYIHTDLSM